MKALLEYGMEYLNRGWSILPVFATGDEYEKNPHTVLLIATGYSRRDEEDKLRGIWKPLQEKAPTPEQVRRWLTGPEVRRGVGIALVTGQVSGRIVMDFDGEEGRAFARELGVCPHIRTGGGYHLHLKAPPFPVRNMVGKATKGAPDCVDIRGDGGNAVLPPTRTRKGEYVWLRDPDDIDPIESLSTELREALGLVPPVVRPVMGSAGPLPEGKNRVDAGRILDWALELYHGGAGGRNDVGNKLAWTLFNNGYDMQEVRQIGERYVEQVGHLQFPAYTLDEFYATARSAEKAPRGKPWGQKKISSSPPPRTAAQALEDIYAQLSPEEQQRGAALLAYTWASEGRPVEQTVTYLRLVGHQQAAQTVRSSYMAYEQGRKPEGTLEGFLAARRVKYG